MRNRPDREKFSITSGVISLMSGSYEGSKSVLKASFAAAGVCLTGITAAEMVSLSPSADITAEMIGLMAPHALSALTVGTVIVSSSALLNMGASKIIEKSLGRFNAAAKEASREQDVIHAMGRGFGAVVPLFGFTLLVSALIANYSEVPDNEDSESFITAPAVSDEKPIVIAYNRV